MGGMRLRPRSAAALLAASAVLALVLAMLPAPASAAATTLSVLGGTTSVTRAGTGPEPATDGQLLAAGDAVATSSDGHAILTFVDGSTLTLEPDTRVLIEEVTARPTSAVVRVLQTLGRTWSSVTRLVASGSRYEVRTPAITATVRGTAFEVIVDADGTTRVRTADGEVRVANALGEVVVGAGAETVASPTAPPAPPSTPAPSTRRVIEVGDRPVLVVDSAGRGCGRSPTGIIQQIPGCVVREGKIEILDVARVGEYRLAVVGDAASRSPVIERTISAEAGAPESVRELVLSGEDTGATQRVVVPPQTARPTIEVTIPFIGTVPVQLGGAAPTASAIVVPAPVASVAPTPLPTAVASPSPLVTLAPTPTLVATALPTVTVAPSIQIATPAPIITLAPTSVVTLAPAPQILPTPTPTPTSAPTATPTATPTPTASPTPVPPPAAPTGVSAIAVVNTVTVTWLASTTIGATYEVERSTSGGAYAVVGSTAVLTFDQTVGTGTHCYQVRAVATDGQKSSAAGPACVTAP